MIRYDKLKKSLKLLEEQNNRLNSLPKNTENWIIEAVKESIIRRFETCWDSLWKILKRYLKEEMNLAELPNSPNPILRLSNENYLLPSPLKKWLTYARARTLTSHDYSEVKANESLKIMDDFIEDAIILYKRLTKENLNDVDLTTFELKEIESLLKYYIPDTEVWVYGSRVKFTAKPHSDLDMVVFTSKEDSLLVEDLKEAFEESSLPFRVDLFVWDEIPEHFHGYIKKEKVVLQKKKER